MLNQTRVLVYAFMQICTLNKRPQDIPASTELLMVTLLLNFLSFVSLYMGDYQDQASSLTAINSVCMLTFVFLALTLRASLNRFKQTVTALAATDTLIGLLYLPGFIIFNQANEPQTMLAVTAWPSLLFAWSVAITGHVFRHALSVPYPIAIVVTIIFIAITATAIRFTDRLLL